MTSELDVVFYGDQSIEPYQLLQTLMEGSDQSYLLQQFITLAWKRLSCAAKELTHVNTALLSATDFSDLGQRSRGRRRSLAVSCVLHTVVQIGLTILHREEKPQSWVDSQNLRIVGLCTGIISAIAASVACSTTDLIRIGPDFVLLSFKLGLAAEDRANAIDQSGGAWSIAISDMSPEIGQNLINEFHHSAKTPEHARAYISAQSSKSFTISGPPTVLKAFLSTKKMLSIRKLALPIAGPFHAAHMNLPDIDSILSGSGTWDQILPASTSLMFYNTEGCQDRAHSLRELLHKAIYDIFQTPIMMDEFSRALELDCGHHQLDLTLIGPGRSGVLFDKLRISSMVNFSPRGQTASEISREGALSSDSIAIVGMAGKFPGAEDLDDLWNIIMEGQDLHREVPLSRFDIRNHCDPTGKVKNTSLTPYGCFYDNADKFDLALFKMSPREAAQTDPMQRLMLITAFMALESAGYYDPGPRRTRPKIGTYYGQGGDDYRQVNSSQDIDSNYITGGIRAFGPGRVSYHFGWEGPSMVVDTACSASAMAIHQAVSALRLKECDGALAGGANFLSCSDMFAGLSRASFLSLTGGCKTLDEQADGYCRADGVATVFLKRLEDAIRDKDNVLGVIREVSTNHAANAVSITRPHAETQAALFHRVIRSAGLTVDDIDHIEMHGTGTQAGDHAEITSIASLLEGRRRPDHHPLYLGAVKPNIGHSEAASGVTSLIKGVLMLQEHIIPCHTGIKTRINPKLPLLDPLNIRIPTRNLPYPPKSGGGKRRILVNNFNATGGSTALLLEEFSRPGTSATDPRNHFPITLSGATAKALSNAVKSLHGLLLRRPNTVLSHLSYTLTARRMHHPHRFSCTAATISDLMEKLDNTSISDTNSTKCSRAPCVIFVFTGQGSHYAGMGHHLWKTCRTFRRYIGFADRLLQNLGFQSFLPLIEDPNVDMAQFNLVQTQLAVVVLEIALAHTLRAWGVEAKAVIGHSLGEYSALAVCGVLSLADTLYLVGRRAQLVVSRCGLDHSMLAVAVSASEAQKAITSRHLSYSAIACINAPKQTVISGPRIEIEILSTYFSNQGIRATVLKTKYAFHSAQMDPILSEFKQLAMSIPFHPPQAAIASTLLNTVVKAGNGNVFNADYLTRQAREPVQFVEALKAIQVMTSPNEAAVWVELGPTSTCLSMVASSLNVDIERLAPVLDKQKSNWQSFGETLCKIYRHGSEVFWDEYHKEYLDCLEFIEVPSYSFDLTSHFIPYNGDWAITKDQKVQNQKAVTHALRSSTIQALKDHSTNEEGQQMSFVTDASRKDFQELIDTHKVTSTLTGATWMLTDMVATAAAHLWQTDKISTETLPALDIVPAGSAEGFMMALKVANTVTLVASQAWSSNRIVKVVVTVEGFLIQHHSEYQVIFDDRSEWPTKMSKTAYLYKSRIEDVQRTARTRVSKDVASGSTVQFLTDASPFETVATIQLGQSSGHFTLDPNWHTELCDIVNQLVGHSVDESRDPAHMFRGWSSLRLLRKFQPAGVYHVHARTQSNLTSGLILSDIHVLDSNHDVVAVLEDVTHSRRYDDDDDADSRSQQRHSDTASTTSTRISSPKSTSSPQTPSDEDGVELTMKKTGDVSIAAATAAAAAPMPTFDFDHLVALMAAEIGVDPAFMHEDSLFADMGVDSLLQISITATMRRYVGRDLPDGLLVDCPSVRRLRGYFEEEC